MSDITIDNLIFDRTNANLNNRYDDKGKYDYRDYNRVGSATATIALELRHKGYGNLPIYPKTNWVNTDIPRQSQMTTYKGNIQTIVDTLELENQLPTTNKNIATILGANQLEKALYDAYDILQKMMVWDDVDELYETWETLDNKHLKWGKYFLK